MTTATLLLSFLFLQTGSTNSSLEIRVWTPKEAASCRTTRFQLPSRCAQQNDLFTTQFRRSEEVTLVCLWSCLDKRQGTKSSAIIYRSWELISIATFGPDQQQHTGHIPDGSLSPEQVRKDLQAESSHADTQRRDAMAFVLGWMSKTVLFKNPKNKQEILDAIQAGFEGLGVHIDRPIAHYLANATADQGRRAQRFTEEIYQKLSTSDPRLANYFGVATNLVLIVARCKCDFRVPAEVKTELTRLVQKLDLPERLQKVPDRDLTTWLGEIEYYFELVLTVLSSQSSTHFHLRSEPPRPRSNVLLRMQYEICRRYAFIGHISRNIGSR